MKDSDLNINTSGGDYAERGDILKQQGIFVSESGLLAAETVVGVLHQYVTVGSTSRLFQGIPPNSFAVVGTPPLPAPYIQRKHEQTELWEQLVGSDQTHIVYLHGMPGVGKTTLAVQLANNLKPEHFSGGVLWGNLEKLTSAEFILRLLIILDGPELIKAYQATDSLREVLWQRLSKDDTGWLLILDNTDDIRRLHEILPDNPQSLGQSRVLAISNSTPNSLPGSWNITPIRVKELRHEEADELFQKILGTERANHLANVLHAIGELLDYNPQLLLTSLQLFESSIITPTTYLDKLRQQDAQRTLLTSSFIDGLEPIIAGLTQSQQQLFECLGVLGEGDWTIDLLSAVALRHPAELEEDLRILVAMNFVEHYDLTSNGRQQGKEQHTIILTTSRFRASTLIRTLAQRRLQAKGDYFARAAQVLLARYCLDRAQDVAAALQTRLAVSGEPNSFLQPGSESFVRSFRATLASDMPHIRQALRWAVMHKDWHLVRRFAHLPYTDLLCNFSANGFDITLSLEMATVVEPTVWPPSTPTYIQVPTLTHLTDLSIYPKPDATHGDSEGVSERNLLESTDERAAHPCELNWNMTACHIVDGIFRSTCFTDSHWFGVRASDLIWLNTDIDGCQFFACDFTNSTWLNVDARHTALSGSSVCFSLLRDVRLNGADLTGVDFSGAILEDVRFLGADLRGANFSGAILRRTSLRRADLNGAIFTGAELHDVDLRGAQVQQDQFAKIWRHQACQVDFPALLPRIETTTSPTRPSRRYTEAQLAELSDGETLIGADLRALRVETLKLVGLNASGANLGGSTLSGDAIRLPEIILERADLRGANLSGTHLERANLSHADARGADFCRATLTGARLTKTLLHSTLLRSVVLNHALLTDANLSGADLQAARLDHADLTGADLSQTNLHSATLIGARLTAANLKGADLSDADLSDADLSDADLSDADLRTAKVLDEQLMQARALSNTRLPGARQIYHLHGDLINELPPLPQFLQFSQWTGSYVRVIFPNKLELPGARFDGILARVQIIEANLRYAKLIGIYRSCIFRKANLVNARLSGTFHEVDFREVHFSGATFLGCSLVACELDHSDISEEQLKQMTRLRGTRLPDGTSYDGRYKLLGDVEDALNAGISPDDEEAMRQFCRSREKLTYIGGR